jgi:energy-coupling factor transporter ATP-binding protein EcfA2
MEHDTETVLFGHRHDFGGTKPFGLGVAERRQHLYIIGQTGSGKSTLIRNAILQDIEAGRGVGVIDPHGDLAQEILDHTPPWRTDDVVYFDPSAPDALSINFFKTTGDNWHIVAAGIVSAFKKIWGDSWGPRLEYILYATVAALLQCENTSLLGVSRMLSEARKYGLFLTLAHQYVGQLGEKVRDAVFGNVGSFIAFRVSEADANILERQYGGGYTRAHFTGLENFEVCARLLNRDPFLGRSLAPLMTSRRRREAIVRRSREKYSTRREVVEKKIERWLGNKF